jgi:hypothetical protein
VRIGSIPMSVTDSFFDAIDGARIQRAKELSEIKRVAFSTADIDPLSIVSKSVVVLCYAVWEGFYNECTTTYIDFLDHRGVKITEANWLLLAGALSAEFNSLRDRHHTDLAKHQFIKNLKRRLLCGFDEFDRTTVMARSNLDFAKLASNFLLLNIEILPFEIQRLRIDKELVGWRHGVAHGNPPDLKALDITSHIDFSAKLLISVADSFQNAILRYV